MIKQAQECFPNTQREGEEVLWPSFKDLNQVQEELHASEKGITLTYIHSVRDENMVFWQSGYFLKRKTKPTNVKVEKESPTACWLCLFSLSRQTGSINPHVNQHCLLESPFMLYVMRTTTS